MATASVLPKTRVLSSRVSIWAMPLKKGEAVALIHAVGRTGQPPVEIRAKMDGLLCARHFPGLVKPGDCVAVFAVTV